MKRLFLGIELDSEARSALVVVQDRLITVASRQGVRFVRPEKLHLTLLFLDSQPEEAVADFAARCATACQGLSSFELSIVGLGGYPSMRRPKVLWAGVSGDVDALNALQGAISFSFKDSVPADSEDYSPHITLARIRPGSPVVGKAAGPLAEELAKEEVARWRVSEIALFESLPDGSYEVLSRVPLAGNDAGQLQSAP